MSEKKEDKKTTDFRNPREGSPQNNWFLWLTCPEFRKMWKLRSKLEKDKRVKW